MDDETAHLVEALQALEQAVDDALDRFARSHEAAGDSPGFAEWLNITALLRRAVKRMQDKVTADPAQYQRCLAMLAEGARQLAPGQATAERTH